MKDRETNKVVAKPVPERTKEELHGFISSKVAPEAKVYTDDHRSYLGLPYNHESVNHSIGEYVTKNRPTLTAWNPSGRLLKRGYYGTYHRISEKHLERYVNEFSGRHNDRPSDTIDQMRAVAANLNGKRLPYQDLIL